MDEYIHIRVKKELKEYYYLPQNPFPSDGLWQGKTEVWSESILWEKRWNVRDEERGIQTLQRI